MTPTTDTTATDAQEGDQSTGRPMPAAQNAGDATTNTEQPETEPGQSGRTDRDAGGQHRERTVVVGEDTAERGTVVRNGLEEVASAETAAVGTVRVPASASPAETDAIVAAVREHLAATGSESAGTGTDTPVQWVAAGRLRGVAPDPKAVLDEARSDPWVAASRAGDRR
jgi:hypothetical protein